MKEATIDWCPTKRMVADFMTKPLQGRQFRNLRDYIMGRVRSPKPNNNVIKGLKQDGRTTHKKLIKKTSAGGAVSSWWHRNGYYCWTVVCWGL